MNKVGKRRAYVFGCGEVFLSKQEDILKDYEVVGFFDNNRKGGFLLSNGKEAPLCKPYYKEDAIVVIAIARFYDIWQQLRQLGYKRESIVFPNEAGALTGLEKKLFSCGEELTVIGDNLFYMDSHKELFLINKGESFEELAQVQERKKRSGSFICENGPIDALNRDFGFSRGTPIDRYYIEKFLEAEKETITGDVLEIAEDTYTRKFGGERVRNSYILHVNSVRDGYIKGNFETGEGIEPDSMDCIILTQTLPFLFDCKSAISNIFRMLRQGGAALITVCGITQISRYDMEQWGQYWSFTDLCLKKLFDVTVPGAEYRIMAYGNVKTAAALLYGICAEELAREELDYNDKDYQVSICAVLKKCDA